MPDGNTNTASFSRALSDTEMRAQRAAAASKNVTESNMPPPNRSPSPVSSPSRSQARSQTTAAKPHERSLPSNTYAWEAQRAEREACLRRVFDSFDLDGNGTLEPTELLALGAMRRELGHREELWTEEANAALVRELDRNCDGVIQYSEFVEAFEPRLSMLMEDFHATVEEFSQVASLVRQRGTFLVRGEASRKEPIEKRVSYGYDSQARYKAGYAQEESILDDSQAGSRARYKASHVQGGSSVDLKSPGGPNPFLRTPDKEQALEQERKQGRGIATHATHNWADATSTQLFRADGSPVVKGKQARRVQRDGILEQLPPHVRAELMQDEAAKKRHLAAGRDLETFVSPSLANASLSSSPKAKKKSPQQLSPDTQEALMRYAEPYAYA